MDMQLEEGGYIIKPEDEKRTYSGVDTGHRGRRGARIKK